jgi:hypothetical protein
VCELVLLDPISPMWCLGLLSIRGLGVAMLVNALDAWELVSRD